MAEEEKQADDVQVQEADAPAYDLDELVQASQGNLEKDDLDGIMDVIIKDATSKRTLQEISEKIDKYDELLSQELNRVMHHPKFQRLEGTWRGLQYLITNSITGADLKISCMDIDKEEIIEDAQEVKNFQKSELFKKLYLNRYATPGGVPYAAIVGDFEFSHAASDVKAVSRMAEICSASHSPFLTTPGAKMFGLNRWAELEDTSEEAIELRFKGDSKEMTAWRSFRKSENSRYVAMTMPRVLSRLPYGNGDCEQQINKFNYQELPIGEDGKPLESENKDEKYCWMSSAYTLATRMTNAFRDHGWSVAIRGPEGGGKVDNLPIHYFTSKKGDTEVQCPTEVPIHMHKEGALGRAGFMPLAYHLNTDYAAFFGGQTTRMPVKYDDKDATASENLHTRLPYIMAVSRVAHLMNVMARNMIGMAKEREDVEKHLHRWLMQFVLVQDTASQEAKAAKPFREASVQVVADEEDPGVYYVKAQLRPHFQVEELHTSLSLVARVSEAKK